MIEFLKYYPPYSLFLVWVFLIWISCVVCGTTMIVKKINSSLADYMFVMMIALPIPFTMFFAPFYSEYQQASTLAQKTNQNIKVYSAMPREVVYSLYEECVIDGVKK